MKDENITLIHNNVTVTGPFKEVVDLLGRDESDQSKKLIDVFTSLRPSGEVGFYNSHKISMIKAARKFFDIGLREAQTWVEENCRHL